MLKWANPAGSTQQTSCGRYCVVGANSQHWVAYEMHATTATELGVRGDAEMARACCEAHEASLIEERKRA